MRRNIRGTSLELFRATAMALVLWTCLNFNVGWPLQADAATVLLPMKLFKSSEVTSNIKDAKNQVVPVIGDNRSPSQAAINLYRLPPSPANLLKPDGFQFYTYNERGEMITKQMTIKEIQALIASGGPDHSNMEVQEPQKAEDILTGGKKVMDVVEKVQNVLKSAMGKPSSLLTVPQSMIPEKANAEWSNILPAILAGDKYGNKVEETHYVEGATSNPLSVSTVQNDSLKSGTSETVPSDQFEGITKYTGGNEGTIMQIERNETHQESSTIVPEITMTSYTEKLMIPVSVITTERNIEQTTKYTSQSPVFSKVTELVPLSENTTHDSYVRDKEDNSAFTNTTTKLTTASVSLSSFFESTKNGTTKNGTNEALNLNNTNSLTTQTKTNLIPMTDVKIPLKTQTQSLLELNEVQTSATDEPFTISLLQSSVTLPVTNANKYNTSSPTESSTVMHDTVTKLSNTEFTQPLKPLSMELINSLSSMISQVSEEVSSILPVDSEFEIISNKDDKEKYNNSSESTLSTIRTTTTVPVIHKESLENVNNTTEVRIEEATIDTTVKLKVDQEEIYSTTLSAPVTTLNVTYPEKMTTYFETSTTVSDVQSTLNASKTTTMTNETVTNYLNPIAIIESMLHTASTEANINTVTESFTLPNELPENLSSNTLASALIAGSSSFDRTQSTLYQTTTPSQKEVNFTNVMSGSNLSVPFTDDLNYTKNDSVDKNENERITTEKENLLSQVSHHTTVMSETTDRTISVTQANMESSQSQNGLLTTFESTTVSSFTSDGVIKNIITNETDISSVNNSFTENTFNHVHETSVTSNGSLVNVRTEIINDTLLDFQKSEEENKLDVASTGAVTPEITPDPGKISQGALQENANTSIIHLNDTSEVLSTEPDEGSTYRTTIISGLPINKMESIVDTMNSSNLDRSTQKQHHDHEAPAQLFNSTDRVVQSSLKRTEEQQKNHTVNTSNIILTPYSDTTTTQKMSSGDEVKYSLITTTTSSFITEKLNENKEVPIPTGAMNSIDWDRLENKTKKPEIPSLGAYYNKSQLNEKFDTLGDISQSKLNSTDTNLQHVWQRISLQQTTSSLSTKSDITTKKPETTVSTASTTLGTTLMETETHSHSTPVIKTESTVSLNASKTIGGLDTSTKNASTDIVNFSRLCNELAIKFWISANKGLSIGRSLVLSPFGMVSLLAMIFLGARGSTSEQMNEILGLDNFATFNPHLIFQNVTDTVSLARHQGIANAAFVRELFADKAKVRKLLPFYKEQAQQFYEGLVAEVNFATISDLVRRRTNLLIRKQTGGRIKDFVKSNAVPLRSPLAAISANVFQTDCNTSSASATGRDGELYFAISSAHRLRKLIPVPATVWRSNVLAGYEPSLDATAVALGGVDKLISTIFLLPGQQGHAAPGDTLDRLEQRLLKGAFQDGSWDKLLKVLIPRMGLELQIPKFSHRSIINATAALKRMGLDQLFSSQADFKGINGIGNRLFLSDVLQMNLFSTCGDENMANGRHHVEIYPASPTLRNLQRSKLSSSEELTLDRTIKLIEDIQSKNYPTVSIKQMVRNLERSEDKPRLKLDQPFLYFVRHNPTGLILHMGRFNPRLI